MFKHIEHMATVAVLGIALLALFLLEVWITYLLHEQIQEHAETLFKTAFFILALAAVIGAAIAVTARSTFVADMNTVTVAIQGLLEMARNIVLDRDRALYSNAETRFLEGRSAQVWVFTRDFYWELEDPSYSAFVISRVVDGAKYWWLYPKSQSNSAKSLKEMLIGRGATSGFYFSEIEDEDVKKLWPNDVVVYDPGNSKNQAVVLCNVDGGERSQARDIPIRREAQVNAYRSLFLALAGMTTSPFK